MWSPAPFPSLNYSTTPCHPASVAAHLPTMHPCCPGAAWCLLSAVSYVRDGPGVGVKGVLWGYGVAGCRSMNRRSSAESGQGEQTGGERVHWGTRLAHKSTSWPSSSDLANWRQTGWTDGPKAFAQKWRRLASRGRCLKEETWGAAGIFQPRLLFLVFEGVKRHQDSVGNILFIRR